MAILTCLPILSVLAAARMLKKPVCKKKYSNVPFSQYIRGEVDFRHYLSFSKTLYWQVA